MPWHLPTATQSYGSMQVMCTDQLLFTFNKTQGWHDLYQAATGECIRCTATQQAFRPLGHSPLLCCHIISCSA